MYLSDLHTHTVFSHGKGTIADNYRAAAEKGLKQIGISDHGLRHIAFNVKRREIAEMRRQISELDGTINGCRLLYGIEANVYGSEGEIDLTPDEYKKFDYVICGFHRAVLPSTFTDMFRYTLKGTLLGALKEQTVNPRFTRAFVKAITSGIPDIIAHLNLHVRTDVSEVGKAARDYGVMIELNGKGVALTDDEVDKLRSLGVTFILNSDAHSPSRVGDFSIPLQVVERVGIDEKQIANLNKTVSIRSRLYDR